MVRKVPAAEQPADDASDHAPDDGYTALDRLRADGLIEVDREEVVDNRLRRYYLLTSPGEQRLAEEAARLQANAIVAISRLHPAGVLR